MYIHIFMFGNSCQFYFKIFKYHFMLLYTYLKKKSKWRDRVKFRDDVSEKKLVCMHVWVCVQVLYSWKWLVMYTRAKRTSRSFYHFLQCVCLFCFFGFFLWQGLSVKGKLLLGIVLLVSFPNAGVTGTQLCLFSPSVLRTQTQVSMFGEQVLFPNEPNVQSRLFFLVRGNFCWGWI